MTLKITSNGLVLLSYLVVWMKPGFGMAWMKPGFGMAWMKPGFGVALMKLNVLMIIFKKK